MVDFSVDDMFMDNAFAEASAAQTGSYDSAFFEQFLDKDQLSQMMNTMRGRIFIPVD